MLDKKGNVCEYDAYTIPEVLPNTPEREKQNATAKEEGRKIVEQMKKCGSIVSLIQFDEFGPGMGFPSMKDCFASAPFVGKDKIVEYLSNGKKTFSAASFDKDVFTGERIPGEKCGMTDGEYSWISSLAYYVDKYNLRLPAAFENKVKSLCN